MMLFLSYLNKNSMELGDIQINFEMGFSAHVRQLTVSF